MNGDAVDDDEEKEGGRYEAISFIWDDT